jgi:hypothetical protein
MEFENHKNVTINNVSKTGSISLVLTSFFIYYIVLSGLNMLSTMIFIHSTIRSRNVKNDNYTKLKLTMAILMFFLMFSVFSFLILALVL